MLFRSLFSLRGPRKLGTIGERVAVRYLKKSGYRILKRNYRTRFGEIDIIGEKEDTIVFFEVKTRSNEDEGFLYTSINKNKENHIKRVAALYIQSQKINKNVRIDAILIKHQKGRYHIEHIENAF